MKFGPGKAWMMASPSRKSLVDTQPSATMYLQLFELLCVGGTAKITYSLRSGMTTGPPPNMIVPAHVPIFHPEIIIMRRDYVPAR